MRKHLPLLCAGLGAAALSAVVGRGGLFHYVGVVYLVGLCLVVAGVVWLISFLRRRRKDRAAAVIAVSGLLQLLSLPMGAAVNRWDVARARAWCERTAPEVSGLSEAEVHTWLEKNGHGPMLAEYQLNTCVQYDRTSFMRWWEYAPATGEWYEVD